VTGSKVRRRIGTAAVSVALIAAGWLVHGSLGLFAALMIALLLVAWRHDNDLGTCFPLAMLFVLVVAVLTLVTAMVILILAHH
jgi:hypothetical protein